jgi:hypothetical protein
MIFASFAGPGQALGPARSVRADRAEKGAAS